MNRLRTRRERDAFVMNVVIGVVGTICVLVSLALIVSSFWLAFTTQPQMWWVIGSVAAVIVIAIFTSRWIGRGE